MLKESIDNICRSVKIESIDVGGKNGPKVRETLFDDI